MAAGPAVQCACEYLRHLAHQRYSLLADEIGEGHHELHGLGMRATIRERLATSQVGRTRSSQVHLGTSNDDYLDRLVT